MLADKVNQTQEALQKESVLNGDTPFSDSLGRRRELSVSLQVLCEDLLRKYKGNLTPKISAEPWASVKGIQYHSAFLNAVQILADMYEKNRDWMNLQILALHVLHEEKYYEDAHCWMLLSLCCLNQIDEAKDYYEKVKRLYREDLGVVILDKFQKKYQACMNDAKFMEEQPDHIYADMKEKDVPLGSYFCSYSIFREFYRIEARRQFRRKSPRYMVAISLRRTNSIWDHADSDTMLVKQMDQLQTVIAENLRAGDVATRCGKLQILVLLFENSCQNCQTAMTRIQKKFQKYINNLQMEMVYELIEVTAV